MRRDGARKGIATGRHLSKYANQIVNESERVSVTENGCREGREERASLGIGGVGLICAFNDASDFVERALFRMSAWKRSNNALGRQNHSSALVVRINHNRLHDVECEC